MSNVIVHLPQTDAELQACFEVFAALRPHLNEATFINQIRKQELQGYKIACVKEGQQVVSAAGFRINDFLAWGHVLYIDDLTTLPDSRGKGYAGHSLKIEGLFKMTFEADDKLWDEVISYIQFYNQHRLHSSIGYLPPAAFEKQHLTHVAVH